MDSFLRDINSAANAKQRLEQEEATRRDLEEIEAMMEPSKFSLANYLPIEDGGKLTEEVLNELFGNKRDKAAEARARVAARGKSGRFNANKDAPISGGVDNSGRLAKLVKTFGQAQAVNGKPPEIPNGMTRADYEIWIAGLKGKKNPEAKQNVGPKMGPDKGDIVRANGSNWIVTNPSAKKGNQLYAELKNKNGDVKMVDWTKLPKPKTIEGKTVYDL